MKNDVVIRKQKKWFNTITNRYVAESTAKRYNSYFKRNPDALLYQAYGDYKYSKEIPLDKLSKKTVKLFYSDDQVIKTKNIKGKTIYFSPIKKSEVTKRIFIKLGKLDYNICDNRVKVKLYRLTRNNRNVCHVFRWDINKNWYSVFGFEEWIQNSGIPIMNCILNEVHKVANKFRLGKIQTMYGHIQCGYYSDIDSFPANRVFGMGFRPEKTTEIKEFAQEYKDILRKALYKIESDAYRNFYIENITIYVYAYRIKGVNDQIAMHRMGVLGIMRKE